MARSKTRILNVDQEDYGRYITAQIELESGEVVIASFKRFYWERMPAALRDGYMKQASAAPLVTYGKRSGRGR
jgi:hypothetical protein